MVCGGGRDMLLKRLADKEVHLRGDQSLFARQARQRRPGGRQGLCRVIPAMAQSEQVAALPRGMLAADWEGAEEFLAGGRAQRLDHYRPSPQRHGGQREEITRSILMLDDGEVAAYLHQQPNPSSAPGPRQSPTGLAPGGSAWGVAGAASKCDPRGPVLR